MKMRIALALVLAAALALPVGYALATTQDTEPVCSLEKAAGEMGLSLDEARAILHQARELKLRNRAHRLGISYEEVLERREEKREQMRNRLAQGDAGMRIRGKWNCPQLDN